MSRHPHTHSSLQTHACALNLDLAKFDGQRAREKFRICRSTWEQRYDRLGFLFRIAKKAAHGILGQSKPAHDAEIVPMRKELNSSAETLYAGIYLRMLLTTPRSSTSTVGQDI